MITGMKLILSVETMHENDCEMTENMIGMNEERANTLIAKRADGRPDKPL